MKPPAHLRVVHGIRQRTLDAEEGLEARARLTAEAAQFPALAPLLPALLALIDRETSGSDRWDFMMINPATLALVLRRINADAKRPKVSHAVWAEIVDHLDKSSGAVLLSRDELARLVGQPLNVVSAVLAEFVRWNVLRRFQNGRQALFALNPNVGTRLPGAAGEQARKAAGPVLQLVPGGKDQGVIADPRQPSLV